MAFRGEFPCMMDDKGRIKMPAALRKQFPTEDGGRFMIAKDLEDCLVIYPMKTWEEQEALMAKLNPFNIKHQQFINARTVGLTEAEMDNADRFLINRTLSRYLNNNSGKEIVLKGKLDHVQIWDATKYEQSTQGYVANIQPLAGEAASYLDSLNEEKGK